MALRIKCFEDHGLVESMEKVEQIRLERNSMTFILKKYKNSLSLSLSACLYVLIDLRASFLGHQLTRGSFARVYVRQLIIHNAPTVDLRLARCLAFIIHNQAPDCLSRLALATWHSAPGFELPSLQSGHGMSLAAHCQSFSFLNYFFACYFFLFFLV